MSGSGGGAGHGGQVDQGVASLRQLRDGDASSLADEARHRAQLLGGDGDELPPVIDHSWGGGD